VRYVRTDRFKSDYARLAVAEKKAFGQAVRVFNDACDRFAVDRDPSAWPASLRVKPVQSAPGVWEMTLSFSGPDGRATWEWTTVTVGTEEHLAVRWRRVGGHRIFARP
jgi:hypothetical protein